MIERDGEFWLRLCLFERVCACGDDRQLRKGTLGLVGSGSVTVH